MNRLSSGPYEEGENLPLKAKDIIHYGTTSERFNLHYPTEYESLTLG